MHALLLLSTHLFTTPALPGETLDQAVEAFGKGHYARVTELASSSARDADWPRLQYLAGEAWLVLGGATEAETAFRAVLSERPEAVPAQVGLGRALTTLQRGEEAAAVLSRALALAPGDVDARIAQGLLLAQTGALEPAVARLDGAWKDAPTSPAAARAFVEVLLRAGRVPEAATVVESFATRRPEHPMGPFLLAWIMERDDEDAGAIEQYQLALELDPSFIDAHKNLAILCHTLSNTYRDKERTKMAYAHYERYFALGGHDPALRALYDSLLAFKDQILGS